MDGFHAQYIMHIRAVIQHTNVLHSTQNHTGVFHLNPARGTVYLSHPII